MGLHFFTSIVANYLPKARVLCESIRQFHPTATIHIAFCDKAPSWLTLESEPFDHLLTLEDLPLPNLTSWLFQHDLVELSTAVKGFVLQLLLARDDCDQVIYLDPDILLLAPFDGLLKNFEDASILLTTHQSEPETSYETVRDNELLTLQHGIFNLGFLGVNNDATGHRFAQWWGDRLRDFCFDDIPIGLFVDQRWPDLIPAFFPDHKVLREPVYNVAGWNLTQRRVEGSFEEGFTINGQPIAFFHFSGIDTGRDLDMLGRYGSGMPAFFILRDWYLKECARHGEGTLESMPWTYGFFANGEPILKSQRLQYRRNPDLQARFPDPFHSFPAQLMPHSPVLADSESPVHPYRIFLIAAPADEQYVDETLATLKSNTVANDQLWLVAPSSHRDIQSVAVDATRYEDFVAHVFRNFADRDIILLRAGAFAPPQWDLRLAWTATHQLSALTVSPLDRRSLDEAALFDSIDPAGLDRLCYFYRHQDELEVASFNPDCVYIRSSGVRELAASRKDLRLSNLADDAARKRWQHLQTTHLCLSFRCPLNSVTQSRSTFSEQTFLPQLRNSLRNHSGEHGFYIPRSITSALTSATLHISHTWGGGVEQWVNSFAEADTSHEHLILKSVGPNGMFGGQVELYRYGDDGLAYLQSWILSPGIRATAIAHTGYRKILSEIQAKFAIGRVIVSSLIGHSLDCLHTEIPAIFVCHDYYPFCSAINLTFGEVCPSCEAPRLAACLEENPFNRNFPNVVRSEWLVLRDEFLKALRQTGVELIAPSSSVRANYVRLVPELATSFHVIRHGLPDFSCVKTGGSSSTDRRLQVLLLGSLIPHKGVFLLEAMLNELLSFADLTLAGCLDEGSRFAGNPKIRVIPEYELQNLPSLVAEVQPDVGLFLSVWPETFSYTIHELQRLCVPPVATNLGAYLDAVEEGVTGFLCEPEPLSFLHRLHHLAANRSELENVRRNLGQIDRRSIPAMVTDYAELTPEGFSAARYFSGPHAPENLPKQALQLYWSKADDSFSEANSFSFAPFHSERQTIRLYMPALRESIDKLRFDPGSSPGLITLERITLCRKSGEVLWSSGDCRSLLASSFHAKVFALSRTMLCATGDDPQIELPISQETVADLSRTGGYLDVSFAWRTLESHSASIFSELLDQLACARGQLTTSQADLAQKENQIGARTQELQLARQHSENLAATHQSLLNSLSWQLTRPLRVATELGRKLIRGR